MYKLGKNNTIIRLADNAHVPADPANRDYAAYQEWLLQGNAPMSPDPEPDNSKTEALQKLKEIDLKSIRSIREYIASKEDAPEWIKSHEAAAETERQKLR